MLASRLRNAAGVVTFLLLLPIPAYATITFSPWGGFGNGSEGGAFWADNGSLPTVANGSSTSGSTLNISEPGGTVPMGGPYQVFQFTEPLAWDTMALSNVYLHSSTLGFTLTGGSLTITVTTNSNGSLITTGVGNNQFTAPTQPSLTGGMANQQSVFQSDMITVAFTFGDPNTQTTWSAGTISLNFLPN